MRLLASRVSRLSASVSRLRAFVSRASRVCVHLSRMHLASRVSRLSASICVCICLRLASVCVCLASACICLASVCVCLRQGFRMRASVVLSRVGRLVSRLSASICVCICLRLASVSRLCASGVLSRVCLSVLVNACGNWLILCVGRHSKSSKGFCYRHTIAVHIDYVDYMNRPLIF